MSLSFQSSALAGAAAMSAIPAVWCGWRALVSVRRPLLVCVCVCSFCVLVLFCFVGAGEGRLFFLRACAGGGGLASCFCGCLFSTERGEGPLVFDAVAFGLSTAHRLLNARRKIRRKKIFAAAGLSDFCKELSSDRRPTLYFRLNGEAHGAEQGVTLEPTLHD